jgi:hypothetical protein
MKELLQREGGDVPSPSQGRQFHTMDWEGPPIFHIVE